MLHLVLTSNSERNSELICELKPLLSATFHNMPALQILPLIPPQDILSLDLMSSLRYVFFVSKNAVAIFFKNYEKYAKALPTQIKFLCVGPGTASEIRKYSAADAEIIFPENDVHDSYSLYLKIHKLVRPNSKILIVKGEGGREFFKTAMSKDGHEIYELEIYKRLSKDYSGQEMSIFSNLDSQDDLAILFTSPDGIRGLMPQLEKYCEPELLKRTLYLILHENHRDLLPNKKCEIVSLEANIIHAKLASIFEPMKYNIKH